MAVNDSYTKAQTQFNKVFGEDWKRHIHPNDRDEVCGYIMRMIGNTKPKFNVWNAATARPNGVVKLEDTVKTLVRCTDSQRNYFIEVPAR